MQSIVCPDVTIKKNANLSEGYRTLPLYEYRCTQCGYTFDKIQSFKAEPEQECPKCKGRLERPLSAPAFQFKGGGWYVNDYAGGRSSATVSSSPEPAAESKPAADTSAAPASKPSSGSSTPATS